MALFDKLFRKKKDEEESRAPSSSTRVRDAVQNLYQQSAAFQQQAVQADMDVARAGTQRAQNAAKDMYAAYAAQQEAAAREKERQDRERIARQRELEQQRQEAEAARLEQERATREEQQKKLAEATQNIYSAVVRNQGRKTETEKAANENQANLYASIAKNMRTAGDIRQRQLAGTDVSEEQYQKIYTDPIKERAGERESSLTAGDPTKGVGAFSVIAMRQDYPKMSRPRTDTGDEVYDYINGLNNERQRQQGYAMQRGAASGLEKYTLMTDKERGVYNYLYNTQGPEAANAFLQKLDPELNAQWRAGEIKWNQDLATEDAGNAALYSAATVAAQPVRALEGAAALAEDAIRTATGQGIDPNSELRRKSQLTRGVRESIAGELEENPGLVGTMIDNDTAYQIEKARTEWAQRNPYASEEENPFFAIDDTDPTSTGAATAFLYNSAMSALDSAMNSVTARGIGAAVGLDGNTLMKATNVLGAALMSNEVTSLSVAENKQKGYTDAGSLLLGMVRGGVEFLSEMIGGEWAIKNIKANPLRFLNAVALNTVPEGVEEVMSDAMNGGINLIIDALFGTEESGIPKLVEHYRTEGTEWQQKNPELAAMFAILGEEGLSFLGGALATVGTTGTQYTTNIASINRAAKQMNTTQEEVVRLMEKYETDNPGEIASIAELTDADSVEDFTKKMDAIRAAQNDLDNAEQQAAEETAQETEQPAEEAAPEIAPDRQAALGEAVENLQEQAQAPEIAPERAEAVQQAVDDIQQQMGVQGTETATEEGVPAPFTPYTAPTQTTQRTPGLTLATEAGRIGDVEYDAVNEAELNDTQRAIVDATRRMAEALGLDVTAVNARGNVGGAYMGNGRIFLNLRSGMDLKGYSKAIAETSFAHELGHWMKDAAPEDYRALSDIVTGSMSTEQLETLINEKMATQPDLTREGAIEEVVSDAIQPLLQNTKAFEQLARDNPSLAQRILDFLREFAGRIRDAFADVDYNDNLPIYHAVQAVQDSLEEMQQAYDKALLSARENQQARNAEQNRAETNAQIAEANQTAEKAGVTVDGQSESAAPSAFSRFTWDQSDYVQDRQNAAVSLARALDISEKKAGQYIDSINSVAKAIADDAQRLDYEASPNRSALVGNTEYGGSIDFSTLCKKRRVLTGTFSEIQKALPNTALTAEEVLQIRKMMKDRGYEVSCGLCYVEGSRAKMGEYAKQFLDEYAKTNPEYMPNMAEINTPEGLEQIRLEHPDTYAAYESFMNKLAQRKPKLYQLATEYKGEILEKFQGKPAMVQKYNKNGGLRLQSFSDFEIIHLIDNMQVIMDMARVGLYGQAYAKVPEFAWAMGQTGLKINMSLIAQGVDSEGNLLLDEVEGMKQADAAALRNAFPDNVGTIVVVFDDAQLTAAMKDPFIDFIIPFHRSQWNKAQYSLMGLPEGAKDYTPWQNESYIEPVLNKNGKPTRPSNYMPNEYWDFNKSGKENAETYLRMCAENNRTPKFTNLLDKNADGSYSLKADGSTDGYWKLLIDFKMYNNDGVGVPQKPVRPIFNDGPATDPHSTLGMLEAYKGGHQNFPVAQDVVDDFVSQYKSDHEGAKFQTWDDGTVYNSRALVSEDTLDKWMSSGWYGSSNPNYAQAYITSMSPSKYLKLTTLYDESRIRNETTDNSVERVTRSSENQPIQLIIDTATGKVTGHEGRHRMVALERNGVDEVPVLLFDSSNKYDKQPMTELELHGQDFNGQDNYSTATVYDVYPLNQAHRQEIVDKYSKQTFSEGYKERNNQAQQVRFQTFDDQLADELTKATEPAAEPEVQETVPEEAATETDMLSSLFGPTAEETEAQQAQAADKAGKAANDALNKYIEDLPEDPMDLYQKQQKVSPRAGEERITTKKRTKDKSLWQRVSEGWHGLIRTMVNDEDAIHQVGLQTGNKALDGMYFYAKAANQRAQDWIQKKRMSFGLDRSGDSLNSIFDPIRKKGDEYYRDFQLYMYHMLNVERMSRDNGDTVVGLKDTLKMLRQQAHKHRIDLGSMTDDELQRRTQAYKEGGVGGLYDEVGDLVSQYWEAKKELIRAEKAQNKPVFGWDEGAPDADASRKIAEDLRAAHPEFEEQAQKVYDYIDDLLQYRVDAGLITEEDKNNLQQIYPHYVPVLYDFEEAPKEIRKGGLTVSTGIKSAQGGNTTLLPLHYALARQTLGVMRNTGNNQLGAAILSEYENNDELMSKWVQKVEESDQAWDPALADNDDVSMPNENVLSVLRDGKRYDLTLSPDMAYAFNSLQPSAQNNTLLNVMGGANDLFKKLCTAYNPLFMLTNPIRDVQDALFYSTDTKRWVQNYPKAWAQIAGNGNYWQMYQAMGGVYNTYFDWAKGENKSEGNKVAQKIEQANLWIEQAPRLAEFMTTLQNAERDHGTVTQEDLMEAFNNAAEVTTNFSRSGKVGRAINRYVVPFWNPGVQGLSKAVRTATETRGFKNWAGLALKAAALGMLPAFLNGLLYRDDDEWDVIEDDLKVNNYLFKTKDGVWIRIPKGRMLAALSTPVVGAMEAARGDEVDWGELGTNAVGAVAPNNPFESNLFSTAMRADLFDPDSPGKTWYGGDIESKRLQGYAPGERYDESTDALSKWIGSKTNLSPKKISYIIDQYSGVLGDIVLPYLTPKAERGVYVGDTAIPLSNTFMSRFTTDTVTSNNIADRYYDLLDELGYESKAGNKAATLAEKYMNRAGSQVSDYYAQIREIENDPNLTDKEKTQLTREIRKTLNQYQKDVTADAKAYLESAQKYMEEHPEYDYTDDKAVDSYVEGYNAVQPDEKHMITADDAVGKMKDEVYREANRDHFGAEYALQAYNKETYAKAKEIHEESGISYEDYYDYYFGTKNIYADKDEDGKSVNGSKKEKVVTYIDDMDIPDDQKDALFVAAGYSEDSLEDAPWNNGTGIYTGSVGSLSGTKVRVPQGYEATYDKTVADNLTGLTESEAYQNADSKEQKELKTMLKTYATTKAMREADPNYNAGGSSAKWTEWVEEAEKNGMPASDAIAYVQQIQDIKPDYDDYGDAVSGTRKQKIYEYIDGLDIPVEQQELLYHLAGANADGPDVDFATKRNFLKQHQSGLENSALYKNASAENKKTMVKRLNEYANVQGMKARDPNYKADGGKYNWSLWVDQAVKSGMTVPEAIGYMTEINAIKSDYDEYGKAITNSKKEKTAAYIESLKVSDAKKAVMYRLAGYGEEGPTVDYKARDSVVNKNRDALMASDLYKNASTADQEAMLSRLDDYAKVQGLKAKDKNYSAAGTSYSWTEWVDTATKSGMSLPEAIGYVQQVKSIKADYDEYGRAISGSRKEKTYEYIDSLNLPAATEEMLYKLAGLDTDGPALDYRTKKTFVQKNQPKLQSTDAYKNASDKDRKTMDRRLNEYAMVQAYKKADKNYSAEGTKYNWTLWADQAVKDGIDINDAITYMTALGGMTADKDKYGKSITGSKKDKVCAYIESIPGLTTKQKDTLYLYIYNQNSLKYTPWHGYDPNKKKSRRRYGRSRRRNRAAKATSIKPVGQLAKGYNTSIDISTLFGTPAQRSGQNADASVEDELLELMEKYGDDFLSAALAAGRRYKARETVDFRL